MTDIAFRFSSPAEGDFFCEKQSAEGDIFLYRIRMAWRETRVPPDDRAAVQAARHGRLFGV